VRAIIHQVLSGADPLPTEPAEPTDGA